MNSKKVILVCFVLLVGLMNSISAGTTCTVSSDIRYNNGHCRAYQDGSGDGCFPDGSGPPCEEIHETLI